MQRPRPVALPAFRRSAGVSSRCPRFSTPPAPHCGSAPASAPRPPQRGSTEGRTSPRHSRAARSRPAAVGADDLRGEGHRDARGQLAGVDGLVIPIEGQRGLLQGRALAFVFDGDEDLVAAGFGDQPQSASVGVRRTAASSRARTARRSLSSSTESTGRPSGADQEIRTPLSVAVLRTSSKARRKTSSSGTFERASVSCFSSARRRSIRSSARRRPRSAFLAITWAARFRRGSRGGLCRRGLSAGRSGYSRAASGDRGW